MEEKILFNVLNTIKKDKSSGNSAPDMNYVRALETIGLIKCGWDTELTAFGSQMLESLRSKIEKW